MTDAMHHDHLGSHKSDTYWQKSTLDGYWNLAMWSKWFYEVGSTMLNWKKWSRPHPMYWRVCDPCNASRAATFTWTSRLMTKEIVKKSDTSAAIRYLVLKSFQAFEATPSMNGIWANQFIHSFLVECLNPCLQGISVRVGSPQPNEWGETNC